MANHGYINRNGKKLSAFEISRGLKACYGLSTPLALFLSYVGFAILKRVRPVDLYEIGKHGAVEHDASLVHHDTPPGQVFAPIQIDQTLVTELINDVKPTKDGPQNAEAPEQQPLMNALDVARARIRREKLSKPLDKVHAEIARGEMAIILGVWETNSKDKVGVPAEWMRKWIGHEQLPEGWKPTHTQGLLDTMQRAKAIRTAMEEMRGAEAIARPTSPADVSSTTSAANEKTKL